MGQVMLDEADLDRGALCGEPGADRRLDISLSDPHRVRKPGIRHYIDIRRTDARDMQRLGNRLRWRHARSAFYAGESFLLDRGDNHPIHEQRGGGVVAHA